MPGVDSPGTDHGAFPAKLASPERFQSIVRLGVEYVLHRLPQARMDELPGRAHGRATSARHANPGIGLHRHELLVLLLVEEIQIDPGTGDQSETEIYHLSLTSCL